MVLIWRGMGLSVVIIPIVVGFIASFFYDGMETKIFGNTDYLSLVLLISGILLILVGLGTWKGEIVEDVGVPAYRKKHDLFWIPILFWGLLYFGISIYLLFFYTPSDNITHYDDYDEPYQTFTRTINIYNPSKDSLQFIVQDEVGGRKILFNEVMPPNTVKAYQFDGGTYMFHSWTPQGEKISGFMPKELVEDTTKFKMHTDDLGSFYQRKLYTATSSHLDYDEAWIMVDGETNLALIDINKIVGEKINKDKISDLNEINIVALHRGDDLIDLVVGNSYKDGKSIVVSPADDLKPRKSEKDKYYALIPYFGDEFDIEIAKKYLLETKF